MRIISLILLATTLGFFSAKSFADKYKGEYETTNKSTKSVTAGCTPATASTYLELNNVRALIHTGGDMWWDLQGTAKYEVPKGSGKTALFAGSIWIGGLDVNNQLKIAAMRFRQDGVDYWPGPLVTSGSRQASVSDTVCREYDKHFVVSRAQVSEFRAYMNATAEEKAELFPNYAIPQIILDWPAHGDYAHGYPYYLAPFFDVNEDGYYDPYDGDYPFYDLDGSEACGTSRELRKVRLYGDQTLWWVYNDKGNIHTESGGDAIGMELHGQAFAFSTNDELNSMTFYNYEIINRSTYTLKNTYFGVWTDADLGDATDDYVGCDVNRGLGFLYNGDEVDGEGGTQHYGAHPPAIGVDFFEGPYKDNDGEDDLSSWDDADNLDCENGYRYNALTGDKELAGPGDIMNGNINGLNFGDGIVDNERWGMRRYIYFSNISGTTGDPNTAAEHYNLLIGLWKTGDPMYYGGNGYNTGLASPNQTTDFMFPSDTDPCGWGQGGVVMPTWDEFTENNQPEDRRFVQSAGPFTLEPGMINDITTGVVWARATTTAWASVNEVKNADNKAQKLFEACFKVLDGPDAPELTVVELDQELIFHIWNKKTSNNYLESYYAKDPFITCPLDYEMVVGPAPNYDTTYVLVDCDLYFRFQGYQVFQLANKDVSIGDIHDPAKAVLVFQCDVKDGVTQLVNFEWSEELNANIPTEEVNGSDEGVSHTFRIKEDAFATGDNAIVNNKKYYFIAVAYAYNNYKTYNQLDPNALNGQITPYKAGRKTADGGSISAVEAIPHKTDNMFGGCELNSEYGDFLPITQHDGYGCGYNVLDLDDESIEEIMSGEPWRADVLKYKQGYSPIKVKVIDPLNVPAGEYVIRMVPDSINYVDGHYYYNSYWITDSLNYDVNGYIFDAKWEIFDKAGATNDVSIGTISSDSWISLSNEQIISELGLSIEIGQVPYPFAPQLWPKQPAASAEIPDNGGFLYASMEYEDPSKPWLWFLPDGDGHDFQDWIKAGVENYDGQVGFSDNCARLHNDRNIYAPLYAIEDGLTPMDPNEVYEKILDGTWAPYRLGSTYFHGPTNAKNLTQILSREKKLSNVNIVLTSDKSLWTRCPVIETTDNDTVMETQSVGPTCVEMSADENTFSDGNVLKFELRDDPSVNKDGTACAFGDTYPDSSSSNINDAHYIAAKGMGWFPGYAIDVETGERLNMIFGESSKIVSENGKDMKWNPTERAATNLYYSTGGSAGDVLMGGKHFVYVLGHNTRSKSNKIITDMPAYDGGEWARRMFANDSSDYVFMNAMWVSVPMTNPAYDFLASDVTIKLRNSSPYRKKMGSQAYYSDSLAVNKNIPYYSFSTTDDGNGGTFATSKNVSSILEEALEMINVVPNPYYGYNEYELTQIDNFVRITNLPQKCKVSIYSVNGTLIRRYDKDSPDTFIQWDLKNSYNITIAGGVYIIHIEVDGVGEKVLKWFGALRPVDLNAF